MKVITVKRIRETDSATIGVMEDELGPFAATLEDRWRNNQPFISCIPTGEYICRRYSSAKYPNVWQIMNVPGRSLVLIHWGNRDEDTEGCILVAEKFGREAGEVIIQQSKSVPNEGFNELMALTEGLDEFKLIIEKAVAWAA